MSQKSSLIQDASSVSRALTGDIKVSRESHANKTNETFDRPFAHDPVERAAIHAEGKPVQRIRKRMMSSQAQRLLWLL